MKIHAYGKSVLGGREQNQDSYLIQLDRALFAVADGVGGGLRGDVASQMAVEGLKTLPQNSIDLQPTFLQIQEKVYQEAMASLGQPVMATTLTALLIAKENLEEEKEEKYTAHICHVGDSRCYRYIQNHLELLTTDHEIYDDAIKATVLSSYIGIPTEQYPLQIQKESWGLDPKSTFLLCSDGLYKQLNENQIISFLQKYHDNPDQMLDALCSEAAKTPQSDNITVVLVRFETT